MIQFGVRKIKNNIEIISSIREKFVDFHWEFWKQDWMRCKLNTIKIKFFIFIRLRAIYIYEVYRYKTTNEYQKSSSNYYYPIRLTNIICLYLTFSFCKLNFKKNYHYLLKWWIFILQIQENYFLLWASSNSVTYVDLSGQAAKHSQKCYIIKFPVNT